MERIHLPKYFGLEFYHILKSQTSLLAKERLLFTTEGGTADEKPRSMAEICRMIQALAYYEGRRPGLYIPQFLGPTISARYVIKPNARGELDCHSLNTINPPSKEEIIVVPFSWSLCGTDGDILKLLKAGQIDPSMVNLIAGHEVAGFIVGVGPGIDQKLVGEIMCFDSHFSCGSLDPKSKLRHESFDDCVRSGNNCDGIVGGIRGSLRADGQRNPPRDGYWGHVITVPASAITFPISPLMAEYLSAPSALESLGNIYEIIEKLRSLALLENPQETIMVVSGLGATGYPLSVIATHYGFKVVGIDPSKMARDLVTENKSGDTFDDWSKASDYIKAQLNQGVYKKIVNVVMSGHPQAYNDAFQISRSISNPSIEEKYYIAFGLYSDPNAQMPEYPQMMKQREFVFSRGFFVTNDGIRVYGVCGRTLAAWKRLIDDLSPNSSYTGPNHPLLVYRLNAGIATVYDFDPFAMFAFTMAIGLGADEVVKELEKQRKVKFAANLLHRRNT